MALGELALLEVAANHLCLNMVVEWQNLVWPRWLRLEEVRRRLPRGWKWRL